MKHQKIKRALISLAICVVLIAVAGTVWLIHLSQQIDQRLENGWFVPPIEIYSAPDSFWLKQSYPKEKLTSKLLLAGYRSRTADQRLHPGDFATWGLEQCQAHLPQALPEDTESCFIFKRKSSSLQSTGRQLETNLIVHNPNSEIVGLFAGEPLQSVDRIELTPELFAQFYGDQPILREITPLAKVPLSCLQSITAIEDNRFLEHSGISFVGIFRAVVRNLFKGRLAQGGSTITQQLVKNYFLTPERTFKRKFIEVFMAFLLERKLSKDEILESYLNVIYMGQNGPFQVRGYGAAAKHYFGKPLGRLQLHECSLLSAIVNSPGGYSPFRRPEKALARRNRVLDKMVEHKMAAQADVNEAKGKPLPQKPPKLLSDPAPYFVQAVLEKIEALNISKEDGLRIFTTLNNEAQLAAQTAVNEELEKLEAKKQIKKIVDEKKEPLQALLVSVDVRSGNIVSLVGGRSYKRSQYNRALYGHRQVGSLMKPFVYLSALEQTDEQGQTYHPLYMLYDEPFTYEYDGQSWSPQNYDKKYIGPTPLYFALKNSMNVPTARLGTSIGLESIIDVARRMGIESKIEPLPSLTLGAFELYPWEITRAYSTLARMGRLKDNRYILEVQDLRGRRLYQAEEKEETVLAPATAAVLVGMLKQTVQTGTARSISSWRQFLHPSAGKTGTTSDTKDAWFVGFTPDILTLVWVGFDKNHNHGLTGSSGAIPIWASFMKSFASQYPNRDFDWPDGTTTVIVPEHYLKTAAPEAQEHEFIDTPLIYRTENLPSFNN